MPNCFALRRKGETTPVTLESVDRAICQNLGFEYSPDEYTQLWYGTIGFMLACGKSFPEIIDRMSAWDNPWDDSLYQIACWLASNYDSDAWAER